VSDAINSRPTPPEKGKKEEKEERLTN